MQRYFAKVENNNVVLDREQIHHLLHVMRAKLGLRIEVVADGVVFLCEISNLSPLEIKTITKLEESRELKQEITLFYCLAKGEKNDLIVQKATELGVSHIVLVQSKRTVVKINDADKDRKIARFKKIALEAAEQCKRNLVPSVEICSLKEIPSYFAEAKFIAYENEKNTPFIKQVNHDVKSIALVVGCEGGFEEEEVSFLISYGYQSVSLGKRILRSETAAITMLGALMLHLEEE